MAKRIGAVIQVRLRQGGTEPALFIWEGRRYLVQRVEAIWKEIGAWWDGGGERTLFRVAAGVQGANSGTGIYELCLHGSEGTWMLMKVVD